MEKNVILNEYQTPIEDLMLEQLPQEIQEQFWDFFYNVPFIQNLVSKDRPRAKDLPRDDKGRIIIDVTKPHILEDMDYFRPSALYYQQHGCYTKLRPNSNPNSEFGKWLLEEARRCREGYVRESDGEWIPGDYYYFLNYAPMQLVKKKDKHDKKGQRVFDFPAVWEGHYLKYHAVYQARENGHHYAELASRSKGKAHPYSQIVYTPKGPKLWGDIQIDDYLFGDDGKITKVIDIPFDEETAIYKVTLTDGRVIYCSLGHLFKVRDSRKKVGDQIRIMSLEDIMNSDYLHLRKDGKKESYYSIPSNKGVDFEARNVLIDPYTLGLAIGDGCFRTRYTNTLMFTSKESDMNTYSKYIPYPIRKINGKYAYRIDIPSVGNYLDYYGLNKTSSSEKFIPKDYIYNTRQVRMNILKGILDTDGTVNNNGVPMLTTTSKQLCNDIIFLCRSLGYNTRMFEKQGKYYGKICKMTYNITILTNEPVFRLKRKLDLLTNFESAYSRARRDWTHIINIEYSHREKAKCVTVDNSSHCYLIGDFVTTHNSYTAAAMLASRFTLGESKENNKKVTCYVTADEKKYLVAGDQTLDKFQFDIDWMADNMEFPSLRLINSLTNMQWVMGYKDTDSGINKGTLNSVIGVTSKDDPSKLRGSRGVLYVVEEFGTFPALLQLYNNLRPSVEEGEDVFGLIMMYGTAGDNESDFSSAQELVYNPEGYNIQAFDNVYDKEGYGKRKFAYFFPGYLNLANCYDSNGNSDVTKALLTILKDRFTVKYHTTDINSITKRIAEIPITPQEAMLRTRGNIFPVTQLNDRLNELDNNPNSFDSVHVGRLVERNGKVEFEPTHDTPIRDFPLKDNNNPGAIEIFEMPEVDNHGKVFPNRYIVGHDPVDADNAETLSLSSTFVLDLYTDRIVAEYTGRREYADDNFEIVRLLCLFYNAKCLYENNKRGIFAYFSTRRCLHLLADTPEYLIDKQLIKFRGYGNGAKGVSATTPINNYADMLIREWLIKPVVITVMNDSTGELEERTVPNLVFIMSRALIKELIMYNPEINVDRVRALGMLMLYRGQYVDLYEGDLSRTVKQEEKLEDDYFKQYDTMIEKFENR